MNIITDITNIYQAYITKQIDEKGVDSELDTIAFYCERIGLIPIADLIKAVPLLTEYALATESASVRESLFNVVFEVVRYHHVSEFVNWDNLVAYLDQLSVDDLLSAFYFLAFSKNEQYVPVLEKYTHHSHKTVREDAIGAIDGIREKRSLGWEKGR